MKERKLHKVICRFAVMLFILLFAGQHSVICWSASSSQSFGEDTYSTSRHTREGASHTDSTSMATDCSQPCHLTSMKTPCLVLNTSYNPGINKAFQEAFSKEEVIASVFHPPRFVSSSNNLI